MVAVVYDALVATGRGADAHAFLLRAVPTLDTEHAWWMLNRRVPDPRLSPLSRYDANTTLPRPESYLEDTVLAGSPHPGSNATLFRNVAAGAESGWDFSSRWFVTPDSLATIDTTDVVPVELNAYLLGVELNLYRFHTVLGNSTATESYMAAARSRHAAMQRHLRCVGSGWRDLRNGEPTAGVSASNFLPLWVLSRPDARAFLNITSMDLTEAATALEQSGLMAIAGVRTTTLHTGQQWDSPNAWAPVQHMLTEALLRVNETAAAGRALGGAWLATNLIAYNRTGFMYEK
jgi:alpha,alpha-trehalase